ncbi:MAG: class I SAM-dependent methyltransferase [Phaeodactylibacter sp.]|nr:class I SAM-dependent methyltransferase [Phaeodactylibacter sp.]MCB9276290.1 class I SAM-dependent methyltransferase [Lewinellaceae bacterium]
MKMRRSPLLFLSFLMLSAWGCQNTPGTGDSSYTHEDTTLQDGDPNAFAMPKPQSPGIDSDYVNTNRVIWQKPEVVINLLGNLQNKTVADIGAGTGFFAFRLAQKAKKVIAIDIDPRFINYLDSVRVLELPEQYQKHLETRLARADDPQLQPNEADVVIIVNTFMYIKNQIQYLENLKKGITPGGLLLIIDFKKKRTPLGPPSEIRVPLFQVEDQLYQAGYTNIQTNDTALDYQYIVTARN